MKPEHLGEHVHRNTAAFIHELGNDCIANVDGDSRYVRVQVLTNASALTARSSSRS